MRSWAATAPAQIKTPSAEWTARGVAYRFREMAHLHLICGLPCAGKTTLARRLEGELPGLRLCPDEWLIRIMGVKLSPDGTSNGPFRDAVEGIQFELGLRLVAEGLNVILETGFWTRAERDGLRARAKEVGVPVRLHYVHAPIEELRRRIEQRNANLPQGTYPISEEVFEFALRWFQAPSPDELALGPEPREQAL